MVQIITHRLASIYKPLTLKVAIYLNLLQKSAMFSFTQKQNSRSVFENSPYKQVQLSFTKQRSKDQRSKKISNLRQICTSRALNWQLSMATFCKEIQGSQNQYSLLLTLLQISQYPLWRNKISHMCTLIQRLHNHCSQRRGDYLTQITQIPDYQVRLIRIFYLNDTQLQEHFRMLIMLYLSYNNQLGILDESQIALGLVHAGKHRNDDMMPTYLWILCQIRLDRRVIAKLVDLGETIINSLNPQNLQYLSQTLIPIVTALANYLCYQQEQILLDDLTNTLSFQKILMQGLQQTINPDLARQALLLCNNMLARSLLLAVKVLSSPQLLAAAGQVQSQQKEYFQNLVTLRQQQISQ